MSHSTWSTFTASFAGESSANVEVDPLDSDFPGDLQRVYVRGARVDATLLLTVEQMDQLEHELERARWNRVFRLQELRDAAKHLEEHGEEPIDPRDTLEPHSVLDHPDAGLV